MVDIFCRSGVIPIEAALLAAGMSAHKHRREFAFTKLPGLQDVDWDERFDAIDSNHEKKPSNSIIAMDEQFGAVSAAKKNAKIATVNDFIDFSRTDLEFLDAKFGKHGLSMIVTMPPQPHAALHGPKLIEALDQTFYQAEFILKKKGKLCLITKSNADTIKELAAKYKFNIVAERAVWQGGLEMQILVFVK